MKQVIWDAIVFITTSLWCSRSCQYHGWWWLKNAREQRRGVRCLSLVVSYKPNFLRSVIFPGFHNWNTMTSNVVSCSYLSGVTEDELLLHLSNMTVILQNVYYTFRKKFTAGGDINALYFHWSLFLRVQYSSIGSDNGLAPSRWQAII